MKTVSPTMIATSQMSAQTGTGRISAAVRRRPLMTAEPYTPRNKGENKGHRPCQAGRAVAEAGSSWVRAPRRSAICALATPGARRRPTSRTDVARGHEQHLQAVGMGEAAEPDERHCRDVGGDIGEGLHAEPHGAAEHGVLAASLMHQKGAKTAK